MHAPLVEGNFNQISGQAIKPRVVEDYNAYMGLWTSQTKWSTAMKLPPEHGIEPRNCFSPNRPEHSKRISYTQVMWRQNDHKNLSEILVRELIIHSQQENLTASGILRGRPSTTAVSHVFTAQTNTAV